MIKGKLGKAIYIIILIALYVTVMSFVHTIAYELADYYASSSMQGTHFSVRLFRNYFIAPRNLTILVGLVMLGGFLGLYCNTTHDAGM